MRRQRVMRCRYDVDSVCRTTNGRDLLAYVTGLVNRAVLLQCEYLVAENRILRPHVSGKLRLSVAKRCSLAEIGQRLGRKDLLEVACLAKPATILAWIGV